MITEDYVSLETAKLLKEKGFNTYLHDYYDADGDHCYKKGHESNETLGKDECLAPTLQMAAKWIRKTEGKQIEIRVTNRSISTMVDIPKYYWVLFNAKTVRWEDESTVHNVKAFDTYEQALEDGISYYLREKMGKSVLPAPLRPGKEE